MTVLIFVLTVILLPMLIGEVVDWLPWVTTQLIRRAAFHLPLEYRARYEEEWKGEFYALPGGKLTKLFFGLRIYAGARSTGAALQDELDKGRAMDVAARVLALAQQTADQAVSDARREADATLVQARHEADTILKKARREAKDIRAKAQRQA
jgi:DivIVA protein